MSLLGRDNAQRCRRWGALALATVMLATAFPTDADARKRRPRYNPPYASIVVDANTGEVMESSHADAERHPASLTKIMTLYMLFEQMEAGKMKLTTELPVSRHAAAQAPSKLGLKPGETIDVKTAILAMVTKSANDVAVVIAEAIGGTEAGFARQMTAKARALGMKHTVYHNASGLPHDDQITTARDQAILGRAIHDSFPKYYHYFATEDFTYRGKRMRNHNRLIGRVAGVDGIKTGYIRDSGFNVVTSVRRHGRHVVVAVFGGRSARARDARVASLIANNINVASAKRTAPMVVEGWQTKTAQAKAKREAKHEAKPKVVEAPPLPPVPPPMPGSTDPIRPLPVKTVSVEPGQMHTASLTPLPSPNRRLMPAPATANPAIVTTIATVKSNAQPAARPAAAQVQQVQTAQAAAKSADKTAGKPAETAAEKPVKLASAGGAVPVKAAAQELAAKPHGGWMIQVGAFDIEKDAKERLNDAQSKAKDVLGEASPFTEPVAKGHKTLYRARFAGLDKLQAVNACKSLKRSEIPCMLLKN